MALPTNTQFNAIDRLIDAKVEIYFDSGLLVALPSNYLMSFSLLLEASPNSKSPIGGLSANEITIKLFNDQQLFNPNNPFSIYYNDIKKGVKIIPYATVKTYDFIKLGEYYVTQWKVDSKGTTVTITACDVITNLILENKHKLEVKQNISFNNYFSYFFGAYGITLNINEAPTDLIAWAIPFDEPKNILKNLLEACLCFCTSDYTGNVSIKSLLGSGVTKDTITGKNQIVSMRVENSLPVEHTGVSVKYYNTFLMHNQRVLYKEKLNITANSSYSMVENFNEPVYQLSAVNYASTHTFTDLNVRVSLANSWQTTLNVYSALLSDTTINLGLYGSVVKFEDSIIEDANSTYNIDNKFIQNEVDALYLFNKLKIYLNTQLATLDIDIRGNLLFELGDTIIVKSTKYNINYSGIITKLKYFYQGKVTCTMTLVSKYAFVGPVSKAHGLGTSTAVATAQVT